MRINCLMDTKYYFGVMNILWNRIEKVITQQCEFFTLKCLFYIMHFCLNKKKINLQAIEKKTKEGWWNMADTSRHVPVHMGGTFSLPSFHLRPPVL